MEKNRKIIIQSKIRPSLSVSEFKYCYSLGSGPSMNRTQAALLHQRYAEVKLYELHQTCSLVPLLLQKSTLALLMEFCSQNSISRSA